MQQSLNARHSLILLSLAQCLIHESVSGGHCLPRHLTGCWGNEVDIVSCTSKIYSSVEDRQFDE